MDAREAIGRSSSIFKLTSNDRSEPFVSIRRRLTVVSEASVNRLDLSRSPIDFARNNARTAVNRVLERLFVQNFLALYLGLVFSQAGLPKPHFQNTFILV